MKNLILILCAVFTLTGCWYDNGERTVFWDEQGNVTISRGMQSEGGDSWTVAACIALPDSWDTQISINAKGSHQVDSARVDFATIPAAYTDGVTEINNHYSLENYQWQCFIDIERTYNETDAGAIEFSFSADDNTAIVYTTIGVVSDERRTEHFYANLVSHQLLASDTYAEYWQKDSTSLSLRNWQTLNSDNGLLIFESSYYNDKDGSTYPLYRFTNNGIEQLAEMPQTELFYQTNGIYISQYSYNADIDGNDQAWTDISFSTDLVTWSAPVTLPNINKVQWDPREQQYIAFTNDYNSPMVNTTYLSKDLSTWIAAQWIDRQSPQVAFLNDGTAVLETENPSDPYKIRDPLTDVWTSLDIMPTDGVTGSVLFLSHGISTHNNRLHATGLRRIDGVNESILYGYSDNGNDWFWSVIGLYEDVGLSLDLIFLPDDIIIYSTNSALMLSQNSGNTWQSKTKPTSLFNSDKSSSVYKGGAAKQISVFADGYVGTTGISTGSPTRTTALFKTKDFETYELLSLSGNIEAITSFDKLHFIESEMDGVVLQTLTDAAPDNDNDGINDTLDTDDDNDGVIDEDDAFSLDATESIDTDKDGQGNNSDTDDDNDGVADVDDAFPLDATESIDTDKDGQGNNSDTDDDNDGVTDANDAFPLDSSKSAEDSKSSSSGGALNFCLLVSFFLLFVYRNGRSKNCCS